MSTGKDVLEVRFNYVDTADRSTCVMHYLNSVTGSSTPELDATTLATAWAAAITTTLLACFPASTYLTSLQTRRINATGGPSYFANYALNLQGTALADVKVDSSIAALLTAPYNGSSVGGADKYRVGRMFLGCVPFNFLLDNAWTSTAVSAYQAVASLLSNPLTPSGYTFTPIVWSRKYNEDSAAVTWGFVSTIAAIRKRQFPRR